MDDRTRFRVAGYASIVVIVVGLALLIAALILGVVGVRALMDGHGLRVVVVLIVEGGLCGLWYLTTYWAAGVVTNNTKGFRPWEWGWFPRNEEGRSAQEFDIPLMHHEAFRAFIDPSDPRVQLLLASRSQAQKAAGQPDAPPSDGAV